MTTSTATVTTKETGINLSIGNLLGIILICIGLAYGAYMIGSLGKTNADTKYAQAVAKYTKTVLTPAIKKADSLATVAKQESNKADVWAKKSASQSKEITRLNSLIPNMDSANKSLASEVKDLPDTCKKAVLLASNLQVEVDTLKAVRDSLASDTTSLKKENINLTSSNLHLTKSFSILEDSVEKLPKYVPPAKLFNIKFLPTITPEQAFIGGGIFGVITTLLIHKL